VRDIKVSRNEGDAAVVDREQAGRYRRDRQAPRLAPEEGRADPKAAE
jgi:hypothetical protein